MNGILIPHLLFVWLTVTVGTQAAVLAGLDITMFIEFQAPENSQWVSLSFEKKRGETLHVTNLLILSLLNIHRAIAWHGFPDS